MNEETKKIARRVAGETALPEAGVAAVLELLEGGGTVPFIARYRKEATGYLDEVAVIDIRDRAARIAEFEKRHAAIAASCEQSGVMTDALRASLASAATIAELEDIYLPYRPKRRTRASIAKERGLEPLAVRMMKQRGGGVPLREFAQRFAGGDRGAESAADALAGARDIIAEAVSEHAAARQRMRQLFVRKAEVTASRSKKAAEIDQAGKYQDYYDSKTPAPTAASHRILALFRGEREGALKLSIAPGEAEAIDVLERIFVKGDGEESREVALAVRDGYKRLLAPSMETELRAQLKERADAAAIRVFATNLGAILMGSPYGNRGVVALDPGFRTGCKLAVLSEQGNLLEHGTIYPHPPQNRRKEAEDILRAIIEKYKIDAVAVGNGTAGRETEAWARGLGLRAHVIMVNESGASIYSASEAAREEFPNLDLTVRGAVSIGRRLQDPMAELVKIDPKSIGVGQYQHDVDQKALRSALDDTVASCVNRVGVDVNTASRELLKYVSGLGPNLADNILKYRSENGPFPSRAALRGVPRMGAKAFEQSAGFLRVLGGENPLDESAVHPESYGVVERMAKDLGCGVCELVRDGTLRARIEPENYPDVGGATLRDILSELAKPGRDPRSDFEVFEFDGSVREISDLVKGMILPGIATNITDFGVFVDIGVHQDGLLHKSRLRGRRDIKPGDKLTVEVLSVETERKRIALAPAV